MMRNLRWWQVYIVVFMVATLVSPLTNAYRAHAQVPWVEVGGGGMVDQEALHTTLMGAVEYGFPHGFSAGVRWRVGLLMPVKIYSVGPAYGADGELLELRSEEFVRTEGTSNAIVLMATGAYTFSWPALDATVGLAFGGVNIAHRRKQESLTITDGSSTWTYSGHETYWQGNVAGGFWARTRVHVGSALDLVVNGGYDWLDVRQTTAENTYPEPDFVAVFAKGGPWFSVGVGKPLTIPERDTLAGDYRLYVGASVASVHPFTSTSFNEFNPGLFVQMRFPFRTWLTLFAEGGAYQWSLGDLAYYGGFGAQVPVGLDWLKLGLLTGVVVTNDGQGAEILPALSPRLTVDTRWASFSTIFIPVGDESAFGFLIAFPIM